ncbi:MAG: membrane protein FxsA [Candidatus Aminicenantes bacterium]|nr:membrane protein FxsA [Candidatus Aminicenantes bacterium]
MVFPRLLFLFVMVPLVELSILIKLGKYLGTLNTILIIILTGILGAAFARSQGAGIISRIRNSLNQGQIPGDELIQGLLILAGGLMLITPGFITDLLGFSLILPYSRKWYARMFLSYIEKKIKSGHWQKHDIHVNNSNDESEEDSNHKPEIMQ